jgi:ribosomal protein L31
MASHLRLNVLLALICISGLPSAFSHPHDNPLKFEKQVTDDGLVIYSNIEKKCFSGGLLVCTEYHPIWKGQATSSATGGLLIKVCDC